MPSPLQLLALALVVLGGIGYVLVVPTAPEDAKHASWLSSSLVVACRGPLVTLRTDRPVRTYEMSGSVASASSGLLNDQYWRLIRT